MSLKKIFSFVVHGHENVLSEHKSTLEFVASDTLTKRGDCILGVSADKDFRGLAGLPPGRCRLKIRYGKLEDSLSGYLNPDFSESGQLVVRTSSHLDARTGIFMAEKAAKDIDRRIVRGLKNPTAEATIEIEPLTIRNLVFDFDDTIEVWSEHEKIADSLMASHVIKHLSKKGRECPSLHALVEELGAAKGRFIRKRWSPKFYSRSVWLRDALKHLNLSVPQRVIDEAERLYWDKIQSLITTFPGTEKALASLKKDHKLYMLSDSDGSRELKMRRIRKLGISTLFDGIYTSDDTGFNKPHPKCFKRFFSMAGIDPAESAFTGDHPEADHVGSKAFGMATILLMQGPYAESSRKRQYNYVDFSLDSIRELPGLLKDIRQGRYPLE